MCLAIPSRVERCDGLTALVDTAGQRREVSLVLLDDEVAVGDWLLVRNGRHAVERVEPERARDMLAAIDELMAAHQGADLMRW